MNEKTVSAIKSYVRHFIGACLVLRLRAGELGVYPLAADVAGPTVTFGQLGDRRLGTAAPLSCRSLAETLSAAPLVTRLPIRWTLRCDSLPLAPRRLAPNCSEAWRAVLGASLNDHATSSAWLWRGWLRCRWWPVVGGVALGYRALLHALSADTNRATQDVVLPHVLTLAGPLA